jgi:hypothetical protein
MSMPEFTPEFKTREDGLVAVEQCAREILEQLSEERLEQIKTDTGRKFAQQIRDRAEAASHATEWDNEQAAAFTAQARQAHDSFRAGVEAGAGETWEEIDWQRMPHDWQRCISDCVNRAITCTEQCFDSEDPIICEAWCLLCFDLCLIFCSPVWGW